MMPAPAHCALIVDDEPAVRQLMTRWASNVGMPTEEAASAEEALERVRGRPYTLAVIDVMMPGRGGLWLANQLREDCPDLGVVVATGHANRLDDVRAGVTVADLLIKPVARDRFLLALDRARQWHDWAADEGRWHARLSLELIEQLEDTRAEIADRLSPWTRGLDVLLTLSHERRPEIQSHADRVASLAVAIARAMGAGSRTLRMVETGARMHDIGKLVIPERLLQKPAALTAVETLVMRRHAELGADLLTSTPGLKPLAPLVLASHEWFNGRGYPHKLAGEAIPLESRIIAVADAYDAMTHARSFSGPVSHDDAIAELLRCRERQFDPMIVDVFLTVAYRSAGRRNSSIRPTISPRNTATRRSTCLATRLPPIVNCRRVTDEVNSDDEPQRVWHIPEPHSSARGARSVTGIR